MRSDLPVAAVIGAGPIGLAGASSACCTAGDWAPDQSRDGGAGGHELPVIPAQAGIQSPCASPGCGRPASTRPKAAACCR